MTEPFFEYGDPATDGPWYAWLLAKDDKQLTAYWEFVSQWSPADSADDPDAMQIKYELAAQEMDRRKL